ncbi:MAG: hypothetical protein ACM33B_14595 [Pseudomonadota bacterium]
MTGIADVAWGTTTLEIAIVALAVAAAYAAAILLVSSLDTPLLRRFRVDDEHAATPAPPPPMPTRTPRPAEPRPVTPPPAPARPRARPPAPAGPPRSAASCEIRWWRGYVRSTFYAAAADAHAGERVIAESPPFRWRGAEPPPREPATLEALETLVRRLEDDGWRVIDRGDEWFSLRLGETDGTPREAAR